MSNKNDGWGFLFAIIVISIVFVAIIPKGNNRGTSGGNKMTSRRETKP